MNLGELKSSLSKLPPDLDDALIVLQYFIEGQEKPKFKLLAGTGYIEDPCCVVIFDEEMAHHHIAKRTKRLGQ